MSSQLRDGWKSEFALRAQHPPIDLSPEIMRAGRNGPLRDLQLPDTWLLRRADVLRNQSNSLEFIHEFFRSFFWDLHIVTSRILVAGRIPRGITEPIFLLNLRSAHARRPQLRIESAAKRKNRQAQSTAARPEARACVPGKRGDRKRACAQPPQFVKEPTKRRRGPLGAYVESTPGTHRWASGKWDRCTWLTVERRWAATADPARSWKRAAALRLALPGADRPALPGAHRPALPEAGRSAGVALDASPCALL